MRTLSFLALIALAYVCAVALLSASASASAIADFASLTGESLANEDEYDFEALQVYNKDEESEGDHQLERDTEDEEHSGGEKDSVGDEDTDADTDTDNDDEKSFQMLRGATTTVTHGPKTFTDGPKTVTATAGPKAEQGPCVGPGRPGFDPATFGKCIFKKTDTDKNGKVNKKEFYRSFTKLGGKDCSSDESGRSVYEKLANIDGKLQISLQDVMSAMNKVGLLARSGARA